MSRRSSRAIAYRPCSSCPSGRVNSSRQATNASPSTIAPPRSASGMRRPARASRGFASFPLGRRPFMEGQGYQPALCSGTLAGGAMQARIAGTQLSYETEGQGPALMFLHAFPLDLTMWDAPAAALRGLHQVVRFDARGFGGTPPGEGLLSMERIADDAAALLDHLGLAQAVVAGCSMGGYAAFALQRRHPTRLRGLVLVDTRAEPDTPEGRQGRARLAEEVRRR